jgi:hypothetical protein
MKKKNEEGLANESPRGPDTGDRRGWHVEAWINPSSWGIVTEDGAFVCEIEDRPGARQKADLIAAAPALLAALKETREVAAACFRAMVDMGCVDAVMAHLPDGLEERSEGFGARASAAIAKAEGASPAQPKPETGATREPKPKPKKGKR